MLLIQDINIHVHHFHLKFPKGFIFIFVVVYVIITETKESLDDDVVYKCALDYFIRSAFIVLA